MCLQSLHGMYAWLVLVQIILDYSIKSHKAGCQTRALLLLVVQAGKMSASKLIHYFSCHPTAFGFLASSQPDNMAMNPANKRTDQRCSDFQTGINAAACAT